MDELWTLDNDFLELLVSDNLQSKFFQKYEKFLLDTNESFYFKVKSMKKKITDSTEQDKLLEEQIDEQEEIINEVQSMLDSHGKELTIAFEKINDLKDKIKEARTIHHNLQSKLSFAQEDEESKRADLKLEWNAIKKACNVFKDYLDIHIQLHQSEENTTVQVTFFLKENPDKDNYYVVLTRKDDKWLVFNIMPALREEDKKELSGLPTEMDNLQVTILLYKLREIFSKYKG